MKKAHKREKRGRRPHITICYEVYGEDFFDDPKCIEEALLQTNDPFKAFIQAFVDHAPCYVVEIAGETSARGFQSMVEQAFFVGGEMAKVVHEGEFPTVVLYADAPSDFFKRTRKFRLWEVVYNKRTALVIDFTRTYDSVMVLSLFGNRLKLRLETVSEIPAERKAVMSRSAHYAIVYKEEKDKYL